MSKSSLMSKPGKTQNGKTVLRIVEPIVFSGPADQRAFAPGVPSVFDLDRDYPTGLTNASEFFEGGALPHDVKTYHPDDTRGRCGRNRTRQAAARA